mmetsp:Transcript_16600/g.46354  ORF Transcript_16600/g.46354 Transcript_16600/m.46354 type:complete len:288 (+) Transcript_16600:213-1076(+)
MQSFSRGASSSPSESAGKHFAARRAADGSLNDPHAVLLAAECSPSAESRADAAADAVATRFLDEAVLTATTTVADNRDYRQVVLVGAATDTRPFRLPWYEGTVIYLIASPETHQEAAAALKEAEPKATVPRGCLLRRVPANLQGGSGFAEQLEQAGFQSTRLSVWCLQGLQDLGLDLGQYERLMVDVSDLAAFGSQICGEIQAENESSILNMMAEVGVLSQITALETQAEAYGRSQDISDGMGGLPTANRWLFHGEQQRLSLDQMIMYQDHVMAAEETDEDFFENFS